MAKGAKNSGRGGRTFRQESNGKKKQTNAPSFQSALKFKQLQKLAEWAICEPSVPSLGAFFGHRMASFGDYIGVSSDPSLFQCQSCKTILQSGLNCTVRIEKNKARTRQGRRKPTQNNVVYLCHFCSHRNLKRGTPKGHMKDIYLLNPKQSKLEVAQFKARNFESLDKGKVEIDCTVDITSVSVYGNILNNLSEIEKTNDTVLSTLDMDDNVPIVDVQTTPLPTKGTGLLDSKRRKRNKSAKKLGESGSDCSVTKLDNSVSTSRKRRRNGWTSLKAIAMNTERDKIQNMANLNIPLFM